MDAIEAFESNVTTNNRASTRIVVPAGNFFIGTRVDVHSTVIIEGLGVGAAAGGASVLHGLTTRPASSSSATTLLAMARKALMTPTLRMVQARLFAI